MSLAERCFDAGMGKLLDRILSASPAYRVQRESDGFLLIGSDERLAEFSELVRQAVDYIGDDFVVFPVTDGHQGYSRMFVLPMCDVDTEPAIR